MGRACVSTQDIGSLQGAKALSERFRNTDVGEHQQHTLIALKDLMSLC